NNNVELELVEGFVSGEEFPVGQTNVTYNLVVGNQIIATCSFLVTVEESMGISDVNSGNLSYYPNPVKNKLHISYEKRIDEISIFDLSGQKVLEQKVGSDSIQVDLSELSSGIHIVKIL